MDGLPTELLLESLSLLTVPTIAIVGNINKLTRELTEEKWLIRQFPHCQIDNQLFFCDKLVNLDITDQLLKISQDSYQSNEQLLWCLVQCTARRTAMSAAIDAAQAARIDARIAAIDDAWDADWDDAWDIVQDIVRDAAQDDAWETAWDAACYAAQYAACYNDQDAACYTDQDAACYTVWEAARDASRDTINNHKITDLGLIGQLAYIAAERTMLIKLPEIVKSCRAILIKKIPNYREIVLDLEIPTNTTNPFFLQYRELFVTK